MSRLRERLLASWLALLGVGTPTLARADSASAPHAVTSLPGVELVVVADPPRSEALAQRLESWFHGQSTLTHASGQRSLDPNAVLAPASKPGVRVWLFIASPSLARVFFAVQEEPPQPPRYLVSEIPLPRGLDELGMEQLTQVVYLSAIGLWEGNVESSRRELEDGLRRVERPETTEPPRSAPPARPTERPRARGIVSLGLEYATRLRGGEGPAKSPGVAVDALWQRGTLEIGGALHAGALLPTRPVQAGVELWLAGATFTAGVAATRSIASRLRLQAELGPGIDLVSYQVSAVRDSTLKAAEGSLDARPLLYASLGVRAELGAVTLSCAALGAAQLVRAHYDVSDLGSRSTILAPWTLQPGMSLAIFATP